MILSPQDLHLLKQLKAAGERGRTIQASHIRVVLDRLVEGGFVVARASGLELVNYRITQRGHDALVEYDFELAGVTLLRNHRNPAEGAGGHTGEQMTSGLIKPSERFSRTVQPALDDYLNEPFSERRANDLARAIDHHVDWTFAYYSKVDPSRLHGAKDERAFRVTLLSECEELRMMNDLSDAAHHRFLTRSNNPPRVIETSTAAYSTEAGKLHVRKYEKPFLPAAIKAVGFWRDWKD